MTKNTEKLATECTEDDEKHRETGNRVYRRWRKTKHNTEKLATECTEDGEKQNTTQRNWQQSVQKMAKNKTKTQYHMCWTPLYTNKQIT
jgi:hypothetical protein